MPLLDIGRLYAACLVLAGHSFVLMGFGAPAFAGIPIHALGLDFFFTLSGFLITKSLIRDRNPWRFLVKRALRILPALWACVLLTIAVGVLLTTVPKREYLVSPVTFAYIKNLYLDVQFALPGVFGANPDRGVVNGSLWSLPVEAAAYLISLLAVGIFGARGVWLQVALVIGVYGLSAMGIETHVFGPTPTSIALMPYTFFACGSVLSLMPPRFLRADVALAALAFLLMSHLPAFYDMLAAPILAYAMLSLATREHPAAAWWQRRVGDISYGMYLYAFPVQQIWVMTLGGRLTPLSLMLMSLAPSALFAFLSWHVIEKPALSFKPRKPQASDNRAMLSQPVGDSSRI